MFRGDLGALLGGGDFTTATQECLADNSTSTSLTFTVNAPPGDGYWFLVREINPAGYGTYDRIAEGQAAPRDAGINAAPAGCS